MILCVSFIFQSKVVNGFQVASASGNATLLGRAASMSILADAILLQVDLENQKFSGWKLPLPVLN